MRNSSITSVNRFHAIDMERDNVVVWRNCAVSLLSSVRFYGSRLQRSLAHFQALLGITPRSFAPALLRSGPAMLPLKTQQRPVSLG